MKTELQKIKWRGYAKTQREKNKDCPLYKKKRAEIEKKYRDTHPFVRLIKLYKKISVRKEKEIDTIKPLDLWHLAHKQKLICPLTGMRLTSKNISLDHKIPLSKGGTNSKENLQLVTKWANIAKNDLTDAEFIAACKVVAQFHI